MTQYNFSSFLRDVCDDNPYAFWYAFKDWFMDKAKMIWDVSLFRSTQHHLILRKCKCWMLIHTLHTEERSVAILWPRGPDGQYRNSRDEREKVFLLIRYMFNKEGIGVTLCTRDGGLAIKFKWDRDYTP
jgi:hypothetical protein